MEALARAQTRLDNIRSVLPLLEALRTISLGSWQAAKKRKLAAAQYRDQLLTIAGWLQPG